MSALIAALTSRHGLPVVDAETLDAFLTPAAGEPQHALLFFTGDPDQRNDSGDVAVVLPELLAAFPGRYRAAPIGVILDKLLKPIAGRLTADSVADAVRGIVGPDLAGRFAIDTVRRGRLLIRASGTEPLIRVMAEGEDEAMIIGLVDELCSVIEAASVPASAVA